MADLKWLQGCHARDGLTPPIQVIVLKKVQRDFPGSPVVGTSPSKAKGVSSIPGWGTKIPHELRPKTRTQNRNNVVTNSIKT